MKKLFTLLLGAVLGCALTHAATNWDVATNVLQGKTAWVSTNANGADALETRLTDGNRGSSWQAAGANNGIGTCLSQNVDGFHDWVMIDLGATKSLNHLQFDQQSANAKSFDVYLVDTKPEIVTNTYSYNDGAGSLTYFTLSEFPGNNTPIASVTDLPYVADHNYANFDFSDVDNLPSGQYLIMWITAEDENWAKTYGTCIWEIAATEYDATLSAFNILSIQGDAEI
ncbi:MAG: hypothetical protein LIP02_05915 [Bacteroidales bacterium]|nr:hypothetical protein [Bacteroidales bacterium]